MIIFIVWVMCMVFTIWHTVMGDYIQSTIWNAAAIIVLTQEFLHAKTIKELHKMVIPSHLD